MQPDIHVNWLAVLASVISNQVLGFLWYGPILGRPWLKEMGFPADMKPAPKAAIRQMALMIGGSFLTAYCLSYSLNVWRPSIWKIGTDQPDFQYGLMAGFFTWIGFYVPPMLGSVAFEKKSWKLFAINAGYYLVALQLMGQILANWR